MSLPTSMEIPASNPFVKEERMSPGPEPLTAPITDPLAQTLAGSLEPSAPLPDGSPHLLDRSGMSVYATPTNSNTHTTSFTFMQKAAPAAPTASVSEAPAAVDAITAPPSQSIISAANGSATPNGNDKKPNTPVIRSSWVWNHFVQTPDNPFRVQCRFPVPGSTEVDGICGVVLTRDKTGSTGSMCRHLSRVHQVLPASNHAGAVNVTRPASKARKSDAGLDASTTPSVASVGPPADNENKRSFSAMNAGGSGTAAETSTSSPASKKQDVQESKPTPPVKRSNGAVKKAGGPSRPLTKEQLISRTIPYYIQSGLCLDRTQYTMFREFAANLDVHLPAELQSYNSLIELASRWHHEMKAGIKQELSELRGQVSLSCGIWKSFDNCGYFDNKRRDRLFVVVAHFVDNNWALKRVLLRISPLKWYQTNVVKKLQSVIEDFGIGNKVYTVLTDGTGLKDSGIPDMYKGLSKVISGNEQSNFFESLITGIYFQIDQFLCSALDPEHQNVQEIVKKIERIADDIESCHMKTEYFQKCQAAREDETQQPVLVSLRQPSDDDLYSKNVSNQTGWRLFYQLISNAIARKESLQKYLKKYDITDGGYGDDEEEEDSEEESILQLAEGKFGGKEWAGLGMLCEMLRPIYTTLNDLEASAYNTAGVTAFAVESMIKTVKEGFKTQKMRDLMYAFNRDITQDVENGPVRKFVENIEKIYNESIEKNGMFRCVQVLDPNFKRLFRHMGREEQAEIRDKFRAEIEKQNAANRAMVEADETHDTVMDDDEDEGLIKPTDDQEKASEETGGGETGSVKLAVSTPPAEGDETMAEVAPAGPVSDPVVAPEPAPAPAPAPTTTTRSMRRNELEANSLLDLALESVPGSASHPSGANRTPDFFQSLVNHEESIEPLTFELDEYVRVSTGVRLVDPYLWWEKNSHSFPQLSKLAQTYMAVPGWNDVLHDGKLMEESVVVLRARNGNQGKSLGKEMCLRWWLKNGYGSYCMI